MAPIRLIFHDGISANFFHIAALALLSVFPTLSLTEESGKQKFCYDNTSTGTQVVPTKFLNIDT